MLGDAGLDVNISMISGSTLMLAWLRECKGDKAIVKFNRMFLWHCGMECMNEINCY
jgi:hypothetical protein